MLSLLFTFGVNLVALTINMHKNDCNFYLFLFTGLYVGSYKCSVCSFVIEQLFNYRLEG